MGREGSRRSNIRLEAFAVHHVHRAIEQARGQGIHTVGHDGNGFYFDNERPTHRALVGPVRKMWRWGGVNWMVSARITGVGTSAELCYMWHRAALGYAVNVGEDSIHVGYDEKQDTSWTRASITA